MSAIKPHLFTHQELPPAVESCANIYSFFFLPLYIASFLCHLCVSVTLRAAPLLHLLLLDLGQTGRYCD